MLNMVSFLLLLSLSFASYFLFVEVFLGDDSRPASSFLYPISPYPISLCGSLGGGIRGTVNGGKE